MLTIGRLSDQTAVNVETIRYYERIGILPEPARSAGGHRLYERSACDRLNFIRRARELGFSLADIRSLLAMAEGEEACGDIRDLTLQHLAAVRGRIADLLRLETILAEAAERCDGGEAGACPVVEALSSPATGGGIGLSPEPSARIARHLIRRRPKG